jgi:hypothetical protein
LVALEPAQVNVLAGQTFSVDVVIQSSSPVSSVPFHLTFDESVLRFVGGLPGPLLTSTTAQHAFFARALEGRGTLVVGAALLSTSVGFGGHGAVCRLQFEAIGKGRTSLGFRDASVKRPSGEAVSVSFSSALVDVR